MAETAIAAFRARVARSGDRPALRALAAGGAAWDQTLSWMEWEQASRRFAAALVAAGHRSGEAVAILAGNRPLWPISDVGTLLAGGIGVGIYPTSAPGQVRQILADTEAAWIVVDSAEQLAKVQSVRSELPSLRTIVCQDERGSAAALVGWDAWLARGGRALSRGPDIGMELDRRAASLLPDATAILIYTSGSTGEPKGARITHGGLLASSRSIQETLGWTEDDTTLSFLPFCHAAERVFGLYARIVCGMTAGLVEDHTRVWEAARAWGPTVFGGLPRFYEKAYEGLCAEGAAGEEPERWTRTLHLGRERSRIRQGGGPVPPELEAEWRAVGQPVFNRARQWFGGRLRQATSGGAALPREVAEGLDALGITVLGAYGLTEHLCAAFNRPDRFRFDTVGPAMPGTKIRLAPDGEILVRRTPLTFAGYHGRPDATRDAFTADGEWLRTGDLGAVDSDGMLRVTGRKKELIALSNGKKVAPLPIESRLTEDPWIVQAVLHGEGRKFLSALLTLRRAAVIRWADERGIPAGDYLALLSRPEVTARIQSAVDRVNMELSGPERVRRFVLLERELSTEADELTPTLKVRRPVVAERFRERLDALYR